MSRSPERGSVARPASCRKGLLPSLFPAERKSTEQRKVDTAAGKRESPPRLALHPKPILFRERVRLKKNTSGSFRADIEPGSGSGAVAAA